MIGKLIKYDLRSMLRKFLPMWAGMAVLGLVNGFTIRLVLANDKIRGLSNFLLGILPMMLLIILGTVLGVLTLVFICQRFYSGLLGREGYLMFTLPVSSAEHIIAKTISALVLMALTGLVFMVSGFLLLTALDARRFWGGMPDFMALFREVDWPRGLGWVMTEGALWGLVSSAAALLHIYAAISLGHLANRHRVGWSVIAYVGINTVLSSSVYTTVFRALEGSFSDYEFFFDDVGFHGSLAPMAGLLGVMILIALALGAVFFFIAKIILDRKLNLE